MDGTAKRKIEWAPSAGTASTPNAQMQSLDARIKTTKQAQKPEKTLGRPQPQQGGNARFNALDAPQSAGGQQPVIPPEQRLNMSLDAIAHTRAKAVPARAAPKVNAVGLLFSALTLA